jgi:hypothetical protein
VADLAHIIKLYVAQCAGPISLPSAMNCLYPLGHLLMVSTAVITRRAA